MLSVRLSITIPLVVTGLLAVLALIFAPFPHEAPLHHIPTILLVIAAPVLLKHFPISLMSLYFICLFLILHTLGGFYNYSYVPYPQWMLHVFHINMNETFNTTRNHYDRFIHFSFGFLMIVPFTEFLLKVLSKNYILAIFLSFMIINGISAIYEIFEWELTKIMTGGLADEYNGQQGDLWDAQKDMLCALLGAMFMGIALIFSPIRLADKMPTL